MKQDYDRRFSTLSRLYGESALDKLANSHVVVAGIGGVGSWAVEALARSGVGAITLIDLDVISESNINRQIHSLSSTLGESKIEVMADRIKEINDRCNIVLYEEFLTEENIPTFAFGDYKNTWILDAIDQVRVKAALINWAQKNHYKIITTGGAGGKKDASQLVMADLSQTYNDPLCARLRSVLRGKYQYPRLPAKMKIPVVYSAEQHVANEKVDQSKGLHCGGYGSIVTVTATMGLIASNYIINQMA